MANFRIKKGLNIPILGKPVKTSTIETKKTKYIGVVARDFHGIKPSILVKEGDKVVKGQVLFHDKKNTLVQYTAPCSGVVFKVNRGEKRKFLSVVIDSFQNKTAQAKDFSVDHSLRQLSKQTPDKIKSFLLETGAWTYFRTRPFDIVPSPNTEPHSIFITATNTEPLAPNLNEIIQGKEELIDLAISILLPLTKGKVFLCRGSNFTYHVDTQIINDKSNQLESHTFEGEHPSGLVGTHIHYLDPVSLNKTIWHINIQSLIAIGHILKHGQLIDKKIISLAGPAVKNPRLIEVPTGACLTEIIEGETTKANIRVISGSVLSGFGCQKEEEAFLGSIDQQVSILEEGTKRRFLGMIAPGKNIFSIKNIFISKLNPRKLFSFTTLRNGSFRAMVPIGVYEKIVPLDILPTHLLRSLIVKDTDQAIKLGALELSEDDLALCTFVCPGKYEYGTILRENLMKIYKEEKEESQH